MDLSSAFMEELPGKDGQLPTVSRGNSPHIFSCNSTSEPPNDFIPPWQDFQHPIPIFIWTHLTPVMIHSALAYYYEHRKEYEQELTSSLVSYREKAAASADSPFQIRLGKVLARP